MSARVYLPKSVSFGYRLLTKRLQFSTWFVTSILVPLFLLISSCAMNGSYSVYLRHRLSLLQSNATSVGKVMLYQLKAYVG